MTTNILDTYAELAATIALQNTRLVELEDELAKYQATILAQANTIRGDTQRFDALLSLIRYNVRDIPYPTRAEFDRLLARYPVEEES